MPTRANPSETIEQVLTQLDRHWQQAGLSKSCKILRFALLRELCRSIHRLRSEFMATSRETLATDLGLREATLTQHFDQIQVENLSLETIFASIPSLESAPVNPTQVSPALSKAIEAAKLLRQDRRWEAVIASHAEREHWTFWQFCASTKIQEVETFARIFSESLWPRGIVLFVESDGFLNSTNQAPELALWQGRWTLALDPHLRNPDELGLDFSRFPHSSPTWVKLH